MLRSRIRSVTTRFVTLTLAVVAGSCGGGKKPVREIPTAVQQQVARSIDFYEGEDTAERLGGVSKLSARLARNFKGALDKRAHPHFEHDPALDVLATAHLYAYVQSGAFPAHSLSTWLMWKLGVAGDYIAGNAWAGSGDGVKTALTGALKETARALELFRYNYAFGVARVEVGNTVAQSFVIVRKDVRITNFKKLYEPGEEMLIRGRIRVPFKDPTLYMDLDETEVYRQPMEATDDGKFAIRLPAPTEPGRHFIEILTEDPDAKEEDEEDEYWNHGLLMVPIYVGVPEPSLPDEMIRRPPVNPPEREDWPGRVIELYNRARREKGLAPIGLHPVVQKLAAQRAAEFANDSETPPDSELSDKLEAAGLDIGRSLQSQGYVEYVDELAWSNLLSPSHRATLFTEQLTWAGFGIAREDQYTYVFTEYLIGKPEPPSPELAAKIEEIKARVEALGDQGAAPGPPPDDPAPDASPPSD